MALEAAFDGRPKMFSEDLAAILGYDNAKQLSVALRPFSICPRTIRIGKELKRGYYAHDFVRIWAHLRTEPTAA